VSDPSPAKRLMVLRDAAREIARCREDRTITLADIRRALVRFGRVVVAPSVFKGVFPCSGAEWRHVGNGRYQLRR